MSELERGILLRSQGERGTRLPGAGTLGVTLFVTSLGVFFATALIAYLAVRLQAPAWAAAGGRGLPRGLWLSTLLILAASATVQSALWRIRRGDERLLRRALWWTAAASVAFLGSQAWSWAVLLGRQVTARSDMFGFTFYLLTGLHAAHLIGGLAALAIVLWRAHGGAYSWGHYAGVRYCAIYWHFLGAVWLAMIALMTLSF